MATTKKKKEETKKKPAAKKAVKPTAKKTVAKKMTKPAVKKATKPVAKKATKPTAKASVKKANQPKAKKAAVTSKAIVPAPKASITTVTEKPKSIVVKETKPKAIQPVKKETKPMKDLSYNPGNIEKKWQAKWDADQLYRSVIDNSKKKHYALTMLPYPSGDLHIGHWYAMTPSDARARFMRMQGYNVLFPMGFDAFALPAENAAIKDGVHPMKRTRENIIRMRKQLRSMGAMFDWEREAVSCEPEYYRWTEWFFIPDWGRRCK